MRRLLENGKMVRPISEKGRRVAQVMAAPSSFIIPHQKEINEMQPKFYTSDSDDRAQQSGMKKGDMGDGWI